jgi:hypothetical protein
MVENRRWSVFIFDFKIDDISNHPLIDITRSVTILETTVEQHYEKAQISK